VPDRVAVRLLLVEDDPAFAALVTASLRDAFGPGTQVRHAPTVRSALDLLADVRVDCVVHDLSLPDGGPCETLAALRSAGRLAPLVVLTGEEDRDVAVRLVQEGAQDVLVKGRSSDELVARAVRHAIERHRTEQELREAHERFRQLFENAPIGMALVDPGGRFLEVNAAFCAITGHTPQELRATSFAAITHPDDLDTDLELASRLLGGELQRYEVEKRYRRAAGGDVWVLLSVSLVRAPDGTPRHFIAQAQDISDRRRLERELRDQASRDPLTDVLNRRAFLAELAHQLQGRRRSAADAALLVVDVDRFKEVNDRLGHAAGDEVLRVLARRLRVRLRRADVVGRLGGDEFAVLLADADRDRAQTVARSLARLLSEPPVDVGGAVVAPALSVGVVALRRGERRTPGEVLDVADRAMYAVKDRSR
jgi:diguanylate cyclase (GGDEF)-like protein/PAS domain S-box-containing protein